MNPPAMMTQMMNPIEEPPPLSTPTPPSSPDREEVERYGSFYNPPEAQPILDEWPDELVEYLTRPTVTPQVTPEPDADAILENIQNEAAEVLRNPQEPVRVYGPDLVANTVVTPHPLPSFAFTDPPPVPPLPPVPDLLASSSVAPAATDFSSMKAAAAVEMDPERARGLASREIGLEEIEKNPVITYEQCQAWSKELQVINNRPTARPTIYCYYNLRVCAPPPPKTKRCFLSRYRSINASTAKEVSRASTMFGNTGRRVNSCPSRWRWAGPFRNSY